MDSFVGKTVVGQFKTQRTLGQQGPIHPGRRDAMCDAFRIFDLNVWLGGMAAKPYLEAWPAVRDAGIDMKRRSFAL